MDGERKRQYGVTNPISEAQPSETDLRLNDQLVETLKRENNFESPEGAERRTKVLEHLQKVVEEFIRRAAKAKGLPQSTIESSGGKIFTFGSYSLGVYGPTSDIDTLVAAPKHIFLEDFFKFFPSTFYDMSKAEDITEFHPVPEAYVPIIKMEYCRVPIDLIFVSIPTLSYIDPGPKTKLIDRGILRGLDDTAMRSLNGTRVTTELLDSVPQHKSFRHALRAIKLWSNQRGIYGAVFGYPGGVAWAIMVARICQLYPYAVGATILSKFFSLMLKWNWPRPIMLKTIEESALGLRVWNPAVYPQDRAHLMPVITPAFPSMCSTHTIMHSTKKIMLDEFKRADEIVGQIVNGKKTWSDLFERHTFFTKDHKYYLSVIAASRTKDAHDTFAGLVQSKVRLLVKGIEDGDAGVDIARPYIKSFERVHRCETEDQIDRVVQGNLEYQFKDEAAVKAALNGAQGDTNGNADTKKESHIIYTSTFYIGLTLPEGGTKSLDISFPVSEFKRYIMMSEAYDPEMMSVRVVHTRNTALPDDVFVPGETKPSKEKKKKSAAAKSTAAKRSFAETDLGDSESKTKRRQSENQKGLVSATPV